MILFISNQCPKIEKLCEKSSPTPRHFNYNIAKTVVFQNNLRDGVYMTIS